MTTLVDKIVNAIRDDIFAGVLAPAQQLKQVELANHYGVSPIPLREALQRLQVEGLVVYYPYRGAVVASANKSEATDIAHIRAALETLAYRLTVPDLTQEQLDRLKKLAHELESAEASQPVFFMQRILTFFEVLLSQSNRPLLLDSIKTNLKRATLYYAAIIKHPRRSEIIVPSRLDVVAAMEKRDLELVIKLANARIEGFMGFFERNIGSE